MNRFHKGLGIKNLPSLNLLGPAVFEILASKGGMLILVMFLLILVIRHKFQLNYICLRSRLTLIVGIEVWEDRSLGRQKFGKKKIQMLVISHSTNFVCVCVCVFVCLFLC